MGSSHAIPSFCSLNNRLSLSGFLADTFVINVAAATAAAVVRGGLSRMCYKHIRDTVESCECESTFARLIMRGRLKPWQGWMGRCVSRRSIRDGAGWGTGASGSRQRSSSWPWSWSSSRAGGAGLLWRSCRDPGSILIIIIITGCVVMLICRHEYGKY